MARYVFNEFAIGWLKENRFSDDEIDQLTDILNVIETRKIRQETRLKLPKDATSKVSTLVFLLDSITDATGRPICFEENGLIDIPTEAQNYFEEDLQLAELETITGKLKKVKFAKRYSYPRRRGTMKDASYGAQE